MSHITSKLPKSIALTTGPYDLVLMKVESRDEYGRPENLTLVPDDRKLEIMGGEEFLVAYVDAKMLEKKDEQQAGHA